MLLYDEINQKGFEGDTVLYGMAAFIRNILVCKDKASAHLLESIEGWIVEFSDGQKIKIKTDWYYSLHRIFTDYSNREDYLIDMILDEKIDDILSVLDYGSENRLFVEEVIDKINDIQATGNVQFCKKLDKKLVKNP